MLHSAGACHRLDRPRHRTGTRSCNRTLGMPSFPRFGVLSQAIQGKHPRGVCVLWVYAGSDDCLRSLPRPAWFASKANAHPAAPVLQQSRFVRDVDGPSCLHHPAPAMCLVHLQIPMTSTPGRGLRACWLMMTAVSASAAMISRSVSCSVTWVYMARASRMACRPVASRRRPWPLW